MSDQIRWLTKSQFAAEQGWSPSYITKLKQQGRLVLDAKQKQIDAGATLALLANTADPAKAQLRKHHEGTRVQKHVDKHIAHDADLGGDPAGAASDPKYWDSKTRRETALAQLAEIELSKKRGELCDRASVEATAFATARIFRDTLLGLPVQLAPVFASMTDAFNIEVKLRDALRQACSDFAKMKAADLKRVMEQSSD